MRSSRTALARNSVPKTVVPRRSKASRMMKIMNKIILAQRATRMKKTR